MKTVAVVPVKLHSERLRNKNILPFSNGKPLCHYILATLLQVKGIDEIYVYCSDETIREYLPDGIMFLRRSSVLDKDETVINEVLIEFMEDVPADIYVLCHVTAPFVRKETIENALGKVMSGEYDSAFAVKKLQKFLWRDGRPMNYDAGNIPRTQDLPVLWEETSGFYIYRSETMRKYRRRIGRKPYVAVVNTIESIDIDEQEDFFVADAVFNYMCNRQTQKTSNVLGGGDKPAGY